MSTKTNVDRLKRKARNKIKREEQKNPKKINVPKLVEMLHETSKLTQHLLKAGAESESAISEILEEQHKRLVAIEQKLGIQHDEKSKESSDQRRGVSGESSSADDVRSGDEEGGMPVSELQSLGEDLSPLPALGDGNLLDQIGEGVSGSSEVVFDEGADPGSPEG